MSDDLCPRFDALSALIDDALTPAERADALAHVERCAACAAALADLRALGERFAALPPERLGYDLGAVIEARLAADAAAKRTTRIAAARRALRTRWRGWQRRLAEFAVPGLAGAAALVVGLYLGANLLRAPEPDLPRVAMMAVFGTMPPGTVCAAPGPCFADTSFE